MKYAFLIYECEKLWDEKNEKEQQQVLTDYFAFSKEVTEKGIMGGGEALQPIRTSTTVTVREGKAMHTDGPFAETKEQLGGFYILECTDLDEALAYAAMIPTVKTGRVEIRPVMTFE